MTSRRTLSLPRLPTRTATRRPPATTPVTGVRIGATHVALAHAVDQPGPLSPRAAAASVLPVGAVRDGEVVDAVAVAQALRQATDGRSGLERRVRLGIGCQKVAVRIIDLPPVEHEEDLAATVRILARERIPTAADDALIDFRLLPPATDQAPSGETPAGPRALVVAARRELVEGHLAAAEAAGLETIGVDLLAFGLARCVRPTEPTVLLDLDGVATVALAGPGGCHFVRTIPAGLRSAAADLAERRGLDPEQAVSALLGDHHGTTADPVEERAAVERTLRAIAATVRTSVDFHVESEGGAAPVACTVSGPMAAVEGAVELLTEALGLPVRSATDLSGGADPVALGLSVEDGR